MAKSVAIKPEEQFARSYVDRLVLEQLSEMETVVKLGDLADRLSKDGVGLATVRALLASNPERFAYHERRWMPASRLSGVGKPFNEAIRLVVEGFAGPIPMRLLVHEIVRIRQLPELDAESIVRRIVTADEQFALSPTELVSLTEWGFVANDEPIDRALALNRVTREEVQEAQAKLKNINWREPGAIEAALKLAAPIRMKTLGAVAWMSVNSTDPRSALVFDSRAFYSGCLSVAGYVFAPDGAIYPEADAKKWVSAAVKVAEKLAPTIELDDAAPIEVKAADVARLVAKVLAAADESVTATRLLEENYEITPSNKTFPDDMANMSAALRSSDKIVWVGGDRYRKVGDIPDFIYTVPEPFQFVHVDATDEEGEQIDVELNDDGLSSSLRKLLSHPLATDVLDEDIMPAPKTMPESVRLVLKSIHRELGTFPLCQVPTGWLDAEPNIQELVFEDPNGRSLQVWVNHEARLMYNLIDWWYEQTIESGAVFTLTKTSKPNVLEFQMMDQPDPVVYISAQRMEELRNMGAEAEGKSTLDMLVESMAHWPKGADYLTILAEINVVRRSSRRLVASLLSSYQCFYQRSGSPVWHFDGKKLDLGFDKTKKKFVLKS